MRLFFAAILGMLAFSLSPAEAQDPKKPDNTQITEILGKTLEQWIKEIESLDPSKRSTAIQMATMFGPDRAYQALPAILKELGKHGSTTPVDASVRVNAAAALGIIIGGNKDTETKFVKEAVKLLNRLLTDPQAGAKTAAVQALGRIGVDAKDLIPNILPLVKEGTTYEVRQAAVIALGNIAQDKEKGPPLTVFVALQNALQDKAAGVRLGAIQSLTWLGGPADPQQKQLLIKSLEPLAYKDIDAQVQIWANLATMSIKHEVTPQFIAPVIKYVSHAEAPVRVQAAQALGTIGPKAKSSIPALVAQLTDREPVVVGWCIWALGRMEDNALQAVPMLEKIAADTNQPEPLKQAANKAIEQIKTKKKAEK